jgi:hypothetical protein
MEEVVTCKDCYRFCYEEEDGWGMCSKEGEPMESTGFCGDGKKK